MEYDYMGAIKIKDGLFLGDQFAAQDLEFVVTNKVTRIINCAGKQVPNHWESIGIIYLTFSWLDNDTQVVFDQKDEVVNQCYKFLEDALNQGESVIVHSVRGHNRSISILCLYFMKKFRWTLYKTLQFLHSRRPDLEIRANFFNQLLTLESRFQKQGLGAKTYNWDELNEEGDDRGEEMLLRNTYVNAQPLGVAEQKEDKKPKINKIKWLDDGQQQKLEYMFIPPYDQIDFNAKPKPKSTSQSVRSILKIVSMQPTIVKEIKETTPEIVQLSKTDIIKTIELPRKLSQKDIRWDLKQKNALSIKREQQPNSLSQAANKQLQQKLKDPLSQTLPQVLPLFVRSERNISPKKNYNNFSQTQQVDRLGASWYKKPKKAVSPSQNGRPSTAPINIQKGRFIPSTEFIRVQDKNGDMIITPYKRTTSQGQRVENTTQPQGQFNRQRAFSPQQVYSSNPYAQKSFKPWKK